MPHSSELLGQARVIRQVTDLLKSGRSVLLFGPEGIGKSAVIGAVAHDRLIVVDPLEHVSPQRACRMRRALDRGVVHLAASRVPQGRELGAVGRIMWRFSTVRVRELPDSIIRRIVSNQLRDLESTRIERGWLHELAGLAQGRPGFATAMGRLAAEWTRTHGYLPMPSFVFAATRQDLTIRALRVATESVRR